MTVERLFVFVENDGVIIGSSPLIYIIEVLKLVVNSNKDARMVVSLEDQINKGTIKYLLLNPANYFTNIVKEAR